LLGEGTKYGGNIMELTPWRPLGIFSSRRNEPDSLWNRFLRETPSMGAFT